MADKGKITRQQLITDDAIKAVGELKQELVELRNEMKNIITQQNAYLTSNVNLKVTEEDLKKTKEGQLALDKEYEKQQKALIQKQAQLATATTKQAQEIQLLSKARANVNAEVKSSIQSYAQEQRAARVTANAYLTLKSNLDKALLSYQNLLTKRAQGNTLTTAEVNQLNILEKEVKDLSAAYKTVDAQMTTTTGGVRKASSSFDSLGFSVAQITRESPAFINSMNTGFMAISNNIPMLVDEINKLKRANVELQAEGKPTKNILKSVGAAFFSWQSLISAGIVLMTVFAPKLIKMAQEAMKGANELERMSDAMDSLDDSTKESIGNLIKLNIRLSDVNTSQSERLAILKEVNDKYPDLNANIKNEENGMFNLNKQIERYIELQINKQRAIELQQEIVDLTIKNKSIQEDLTDAYEYFSDRKKEADAEAVKSLSKSYDAAIEKNRELIASGNSTVESTKRFNEEIAELDSVYENFSYKQIKYYQLLDIAERSQENLNNKTKEFKELLNETPSNKIVKGSIAYYQELIDVNNKWIKANGTEANIKTVRAIQSQNEKYQKQIDLINGLTKSGKGKNKEDIVYLEGSVGWYKKLISETQKLIDQSDDPNVIEKLQEDIKGFEDEVKRLTTGDKYWLDQVIDVDTEKFDEDIDILKQGIKNYAESLGLDGDVALEQFIAKHGLTFDKVKDGYKDLADQAKKYKSIEISLLKETEDLKKEIYEKSFEFASELTDALFELKINKLDDEIDASNDHYDALIDAASGNADEQERLEEEKAAREEALQKKKEELEKKQFLASQAFKLTEIAMETAKSLVAIKAQIAILLANPYTAPLATLAAAQIPFVITSGALGAATILAQSIPQFAEGGIMDKDGLMMINDHYTGRQEFVERDGKIFTTTSKNAIIQGQKDDIIHKDLNTLLSSHNINNDDIYKASIMASLKSQGNTSNSEKMFDNALKNLKKDINQGIRSGFRNVNINVKNSVDLGWNKFKNDRL